MWFFIDSWNLLKNFGNGSFVKDVRLIIFGDVYFKNRNYCMFDVICESERVFECEEMLKFLEI